ncbi:MAG: hypothetical protein V1907_00905 [Candidatus Kerfeldbacteria bacterium]
MMDNINTTTMAYKNVGWALYIILGIAFSVIISWVDNIFYDLGPNGYYGFIHSWPFETVRMGEFYNITLWSNGVFNVIIWLAALFGVPFLIRYFMKKSRAHQAPPPDNTSSQH